MVAAATRKEVVAGWDLTDSKGWVMAGGMVSKEMVARGTSAEGTNCSNGVPPTKARYCSMVSFGGVETGKS